MRSDRNHGRDDGNEPTVGTGAPAPIPPVFDSSTILGLDCSHHQGTIDFAKVKAAGASFVFIKATEGLDFVDPNFTQYWQAAKDAGIPRGVYHFFHPQDDLQSQIDFFCKTVGALEAGDLPPVLDIEVPAEWTGFTVAQRVQMILGWLQGVEAKLGVQPIIYINNTMANTVLSNPAAFKSYVLWIAFYTSLSIPVIPLPWTVWTFWQYTETGTIDGVSGAVDLDRFNGSLADLQRLRINSIGPDRSTLVGRVSSWFQRWFSPWGRRLRKLFGLV